MSQGVSMEKKTNFLKKIVTFSAGMVTMAILVTAIIPASAAGNQIAYNQVGIRTFGEQRVTAGEPYIAPNGQEVPSSITYTDAAGGKTNYLSVRQLCELMDAAVAWNADVNSVDIAPPYSDVSVVAGEEAAEVETASAPKYGQVVGGIEEIDPSTVADIINDPTYRTRNYARDMKVQFLNSDFPGLTMDCLQYAGPYVVFSVTNNGTQTVYSEVRRDVTISSWEHEDFAKVAIPAGDTLVRVFRILDDASPLQTTLHFDVDAPVALGSEENDITLSLLQFDDTLI